MRRRWLTLSALAVASLPASAAAQMPDALITDAGRSILDVGVVGAVLLLAIAVLAWTVRTWRGDVASLNAKFDAALAAMREELRLEREAHQKTRDAHLAEIRDLRRIYEPLDEIRMALVRMSIPGERGGGA